MNGNKFLVNEDQGVQYIYERAEVEAAPKRKPFQKALLTLGFLGLTAGASAAAIGQFATGVSNQASADSQVAVVSGATSPAAKSSGSNGTTASSASAATASKPATISLPAAPKSFGSTSHSTQKGGTTKAGTVSFSGENESGDD
jgi:hypothetical protein